jgi:hypothetical protein
LTTVAVSAASAAEFSVHRMATDHGEIFPPAQVTPPPHSSRQPAQPTLALYELGEFTLAQNWLSFCRSIILPGPQALGRRDDHLQGTKIPAAIKIFAPSHIFFEITRVHLDKEAFEIPQKSTGELPMLKLFTFFYSRHIFVYDKV